MSIDPSMMSVGTVSANYGAAAPVRSAAVQEEAAALPSESVSISASAVKKEPAAEKKAEVSAPAAEAKTEAKPKTEEKAPPASETPKETPRAASSGNVTTLVQLEGEGIVGNSAYKKGLIGDQYMLHDGFDSSRDITAVSAKEGSPSDPYTFKITMKELKEGAQYGHLDAYLLLNMGTGGQLALPDDIPGSTANPWNLALAGYDDKNFAVYDEQGQMDKGLLKGVKFDTKSSSVEFSLDKEALRQKGWKDGEALQIQPFTAKDFVKQVTDSMDKPGSKAWDTGKLEAFMDTLKDAGPVGDPNARPVEKWRNDVIYFLLTDRFADGDKTNNMNVNLDDPKRYHGGDLQGIIDNLDYISDLGATTIWLTPPMLNQTEFFDSEGYHGYWPIDFFDTDPHVGSMEKFEELVAKAHDKDLKIVLDIPLNHTAWEHPFYKDPEKHDWFHHIGDIQDFDDPYQAENGSLFGLPDLAQENPEVEKYLFDVAKFWVDKGIDGFRLDAVKNVPAAFWAKFAQEMHEYAGDDFFMVGECFDGDPAKVGKYQKGDMDSLFDYPLHFTMLNVLAKDGSMNELAAKLEQCNNTYEHPGMMSVFLDNHDTPRFLHEAGENKEKLKLALAFAMTVDRIPTIYYGTEVGMSGNTDIMGEIENRNDMEWNKDPQMLDHFKTLGAIRKDNVAFREGQQLEMWRDDKIFAYSRMHEDQEGIVILNNDYGSQSREIPLRAESGLQNGSKMKDLLTGEIFTVQDGKLNVHVNGKAARIFVPVK